MTAQAERVAKVAAHIPDVLDFPRPGVVFKDITPLLASPDAFRAAVDALVDVAPRGIDAVVGIEARGFMFAAPVALHLGVGFVPVRKPGKLPRAVYSQTFDLEYGTDTLTVHRDAIQPGATVLVVDDVLATGGTIGATKALMSRLGAEVVHVAVILELSFLNGRSHLAGQGIGDVAALITV